MIQNNLLRILHNGSIKTRFVTNIRPKTTSIDLEKLEKESVTSVDVIDEELKIREEEIERKRNKSRLKDCDRRFLFEQNPYPEPTHWQHGTIKYLRRLYGRYGEASGVNPSICWPIKEDLNEAIEYEQIAYPFTPSQMIADAKQKKFEKNERIRLRQEAIVKKMEKLDDMKRELHAKLKKKESEALIAKERKERLIEEVRMHFGYTVDPRDERFKEMLEKKEKEQKKATKEAKQKAREQNMLKLLTKKPSSTGSPTKEDDKKQ